MDISQALLKQIGEKRKNTLESIKELERVFKKVKEKNIIINITETNGGT